MKTRNKKSFAIKIIVSGNERFRKKMEISTECLYNIGVKIECMV